MRNIALFFLISVLLAPVYGQVTLVQNGGFESGAVDGTLANVVNWTANHTTAGQIVADAGAARSGSNYLALNAYSNSSHYLQQEIPATAGMTYRMDGYMMTPAGADEFNPINGYTYLVIKFYNGSSKIGSDVVSPLMNAANKPTSWTHFETPVAIAPVGTTAIRASFAYRQGSPADVTASGLVYFDDLRVYEAPLPAAGAILNPSFDVQPVGTYDSVPCWPEYWWDDMGVNKEYPRTGAHSLLLWWENQGLAQSWEATEGFRYETTAYVASPSSDPMGGYATNTFAALLLDFFDVSGTKLSSSDSAWFTSDSPTDVWTQLVVSAVAPVGTVTAKTTCCIVTILADDLEYGGKVYFDDVSQRVVSSGGTTSGLLSNPGFEDGALGNVTNELPDWTWAGGTNAAFIVDEESDEGAQSLLIVWPNNLAGQDAEADNDMSYILEGSMRMASDLPITNDAFASLMLEFLTPESGAAGETVSTVQSEPLDISSATDTWLHFSVTNRPPYSGPVTARVWCSFLDTSSQYTNAAKIYYDNLTLIETNLGTVANSQAGEVWNPGFEYSAAGTKLQYIEDWEAMGLAGQIDNTYSRSGDHALKIYYTETLLAQAWDATPGEKHTVSGWASTPSGAEQFTTLTNGTRAALLLQYMDDTTNALATYIDWYDSDSTADTWSNLTATGVAPIGTVTARVVCAVLGMDDGFSGAVWFDDITQDFLYSGVTTNGMCLNPGFDDNIQGNLYDMDLAGELHNWTWLGGDDAGFIVDDPVQAGEQAAVIVWPNNLIAQDFTPTAGMGYIVEGYIQAPSGANSLTDTTAYASLLLQFLPDNPNEVTQAVSTVSSLKLDYTSPKDTWIKFSVTNRAPWYPVSTGRVMCAYLDMDTDTNDLHGGSVVFDSITITATNLGPMVNETSGELENPGFEYTANGTTLGAIDDWQNLGFDGVIDNSFTRTGDRALKIFYFETLLAQYWPATPGEKHEVGGYVATRSGVEQLACASNSTKAMLLLQYLDDSGTNVLATYESEWFTTNQAADVWMNLQAAGVAPLNTVTARVLCALLGPDDGFSGAVWFDDISHSKLQDGPIMTGMLWNAGFDDNILGNAYVVNGNDSSADELPGWNWFGGDNAGFLVNGYSQAGGQSLAISWPQNYMVQAFDADEGNQYKVEGYMYTPAGEDKFTSDGTCYGQISMAFYIDGAADPHLESIVVSENFTHNRTADTWHYFCITGMAPTVELGQSITGTVACTIISENEDPNEDWELGGIIVWDSIMLQNISSGPSDPYADWLTAIFGGTGVPNTGADEDYDGDNFSNWNEFIAGTSPTNASAHLVVNSVSEAQVDQLVLSWPSVAGRYYRILGGADLGSPFTVLVPNISATAPLNVYTTNTSAVEGYYYRVEVSTSSF